MIIRRRTEGGRHIAAPTIQTGNLAQKLISALGIHGKVAAPTLGDQVHPVVMLEDLTRPSWWTQGVERPAFGANVLTPTAGQFQVWGLCNPSTSNVIAFVEEITAWNSVVTLVYMTLSQTFPATASPTAFWRDTAVLQSGAPALIMRSESLVAPIGGALIRAGNTSTTNLQIIETPNVVLAPGWCVRVESQTASQALGVSFKWRERFIDA